MDYLMGWHTVFRDAQIAEEHWEIGMRMLGATADEIALAREIAREVASTTTTRYLDALGYLRQLVCAGVPMLLWRLHAERAFGLVSDSMQAAS